MGYGFLGLQFGLLVILLLILVGTIAVYCIYLSKLQSLLEEVENHNRLLPPSNVWLMLIPLFNLVYGFIMYPKICDSLRNEFEFRDAPQESYARNLGLALPIVRISGILLGVLSAVAWMVLWIIFWVKMNELKQHLQVIGRNTDGNIRVSNRSDILD